MRLSRRAILGSLSTFSVSALVGALFPEVSALASTGPSGPDWAHADLLNIRVTEVVEVEGETTAASAEGFLADGSKVLKSSWVDDESVLHVSGLRMQGDDLILDSFDEQWKIGDDELVLIGASKMGFTGGENPENSGNMLRAGWKPCPTGTVPKSACTAVSKDFWICCAAALGNLVLAAVICPGCLATYCTKRTILCSPTP